MIKLDWPQLILVFLVFCNLIAVAGLNGKPREGTWNWPMTFMRQMLLIALLYWGGFFS